MNLAQALQLCHHKTVGQVCSCCQSYNDANLVHDLLNVLVLVVFIAGKDLYEVVERTCAWKCGLDLSVESDKLGPRHDRDCKLRALFHVIWGTRWGGLLRVGNDEREKSKYVSLDTIWRDAIRAGLKKLLGCRYNVVRRTDGR